MEISKNEQGSQGWFDDRKLKLTGSKAQVIATAGKGMETYIQELIDEYNGIEKPRFSNEHTRRGNDLEPVARALYELKKKKEVKEIGFIKFNEWVGGSVDGSVGKNGIIEIKCFNDKKHKKAIKFGERIIDKSYIWQVQWYLMITGRKWCDIVLFNPNFKKSLLTFRQKPDLEKQRRLKRGIRKAIKLIKTYEIRTKHKPSSRTGERTNNTIRRNIKN